MMPSGRRQFLRLAAGGLVLSGLGPLPARAMAGSARFAPPSVPMAYSRTVERMLPGGASVMVRRLFGVSFIPATQGYRIEGEQVAVNVSGPPALDALLNLERERQEVGLFPILLDDSGRIIERLSEAQEASIDDAVREVAQRLAATRYDPLERAQLNQFVNAIHTSAGRIISELPEDLFAPRELSRTQRREVAVPGGMMGEVTTTFTATRDEQSGLMSAARREVVTRLAGEVRQTLEIWELGPAI